MLSHPLGMCGRAVKLGSRLEGFELAGHRGLLRLGDQSLELFLRERLERASRLESLIETFHGIAAIDNDRCRQIQSVVETFDGPKISISAFYPGYRPSEGKAL